MHRSERGDLMTRAAQGIHNVVRELIPAEGSDDANSHFRRPSTIFISR